MDIKKKSDFEKGIDSSLYFAFGLNIMLFFSWYALNYKTYDKADITIDIVQMVEELEEDIPITELKTPPPPPPPPSAPEIITIVEDVAEIEETIIESSEMTQEERIEIVEVSEVNVEEIDEDIEVPFAVVESVPIYPGCEGGNNNEIKDCFQKKIMEHVMKNFKYPDMAVELGIHGKVFVVFVIDKDGMVSNIRTRGPDKILEKEASRIVSLLPKMIPGKQRGRPVKVPFSLPINFKYAEY